ncbi:MAG TPA: fasciclin domain-containing protein, partial [Chitinophagaceae bacterium]|nr:fasciclin domain-containing protein [Chitinophagaceae bacterium]
PTNAAFDKLPPGTVDDLLKPENKEKLADILQYHVSVGVYNAEQLQDGQSLGQANGGNIKISKQGDQITVNGSAKVIASIPASNGIIHVIDGVLTDSK